jgi:hypothetical protein
LLFDEDLLGAVTADYQIDDHGSHTTGDNGVKTACSAISTLTGRNGNFSDGTMADAEYGNDIECRWLIDQSELNPGGSNAFIALTFTRFSTEPGADFVLIYDGDSTSAPLIGTLTGYDVPSTLPLLSTGTKMLVRFVTDGKQTGQQLGWNANFVSIALSQARCGSANEGHTLRLACDSGFKIQKVQFASYGTPQGYCSNSVPGISPNSNPNGNSNGESAGAGSGGDDGVVLFKTGYCHAASSKTKVEEACLHQPSCSIDVSDTTFGGGADPCPGIQDTTRGSAGTDDAAVTGSDAFPRTDRPYSGSTSKRLFVQVVCEGETALASNCFDQCHATGSCLYGLSQPHCGWCTKYGERARSAIIGPALYNY